ncbi:transporter substrate-binding domain-containing protein [Mycetocola zhadangensis]|uniref:ABC transporter substrate-binding protein n=1 Tax=Mycetocola zhadangensis TaxID=1164595 RepID=A0A3L7IWP5_9MICO|nr:transporter substrate-binding domain-containing protein [Mycetocola zhadangensis]RLQ82636.1 ABC transporter substrate-binding protein [Mycetocola zhadangensis]GGE99632.1 ABC transporter substrate-binding protein [Mycetocola zhadangensis]
MNTPAIRALAAAGLVLSLTGCASQFPADPDGTLERVTGGTLRVGLSPNGNWADMTDGGEASGIEVTLVEEFADTIDAEVVWTEGGEEKLFTDLAAGRLDMVIGGLTDTTPWSEKAAITKPFDQVTTDDGATRKHVMAAAMGENAFLVELERFLGSQESAP